MAKAANRNKNKNKPAPKRHSGGKPSVNRTSPQVNRSSPQGNRSTERSSERNSERSSQSSSQNSESQPRSQFDGPLRSTFKRGFFLYGRNSVQAALKNETRECSRLIGTKKALDNAHDLLKIRPDLKVEVTNGETLDATVGTDSPHQGLLLDVLHLPTLHLSSLKPDAGKNIILVLDQVTDPHNVGACIRSAAALGARGIVTQDRNSPYESGVLARASSGGIETCPWVRVTNLAQALDELKEMGYWSVGLDGATDMSIKDVSAGDNIAIVMGSEGSGLRPLVRKHCDLVAKIPMSGKVESLNVSNAAAIAMYELGG